MAPPLRIGIAGIRHSHIRTLVRQWRATEDAEIVAAADAFESARALARDEWKIPNVYAGWDELLDAHELDAVTATLPNTQHAEICEVCAGRGLPLFIEKPLAASLADADRMVQAVERCGTPAMVNWPTLGDLAYERAAELIQQGLIGEPRQFVFRGGNAIALRRCEQPDWFQWLFDAAQGGGSWIDFAGYGAVACLLWMGRPRHVVARGATLSDPALPADDSAAVLLEFDRGLGLMQTSHVQVGGFGPGWRMLHCEITGETGTLLVTRGNGATKLHWFDDGERRDGEEVPVDPPPDELRNGVRYFAHLLRTGGLPQGRACFRFNREVVALIDAGLRALTSGAAAAVPPPLDR